MGGAVRSAVVAAFVIGSVVAPLLAAPPPAVGSAPVFVPAPFPQPSARVVPGVARLPVAGHAESQADPTEGTKIMSDEVMEWVRTFGPAAILGAVSLFIAFRGSRRAESTNLSNKVDELAQAVARLEGTVEAGTKQILDRLSNLERRGRRG